MVQTICYWLMLALNKWQCSHGVLVIAYETSWGSCAVDKACMAEPRGTRSGETHRAQDAVATVEQSASERELWRLLRTPSLSTFASRTPGKSCLKGASSPPGSKKKNVHFGETESKSQKPSPIKWREILGENQADSKLSSRHRRLLGREKPSEECVPQGSEPGMSSF
eukprot:638098-Prorocentrum_minimum.AAC.3